MKSDGRATISRSAMMSALVLAWGGMTPCFAHADSEAQVELTLASGKLHGRWHAALRDLDHVLGIDVDADGQITETEWEARRPEATRYFQNHVSLTSEGQSLPVETSAWSLGSTLQGRTACLEFTVTPPWEGAGLLFEYRAFFDEDPWHRAHAVLSSSDGRQAAVVLGPERRRWLLDPPMALPAPVPPLWYGRWWVELGAVGAAIGLVVARAVRGFRPGGSVGREESSASGKFRAHQMAD